MRELDESERAPLTPSALARLPNMAGPSQSALCTCVCGARPFSAPGLPGRGECFPT